MADVIVSVVDIAVGCHWHWCHWLARVDVNIIVIITCLQYTEVSATEKKIMRQ